MTKKKLWIALLVAFVVLENKLFAIDFKYIVSVS